MENEVKPPLSQLPSVSSDFPGLSPMPNSPQCNNNKISAIYIGAHTRSHKDASALPNQTQLLSPSPNDFHTRP